MKRFDEQTSPQVGASCKSSTVNTALNVCHKLKHFEFEKHEFKN